MTRQKSSRTRIAGAVVSAGALGCAFVSPAICAAQGYPSRPIRIVVPFPPGGTSDTQIRILSPRLAEALGQPIVVDNRAGATGMVGAELVARAVPDGHTLLMTDVGNLMIAPLVNANAPYDTVRDFAPVKLLSFTPHVFAVRPGLPVTSVADLIQYSRAHPGKVSWATSLGGATHLAGLALAQHHKIDWLEVPTKGGTDSILVVLSNQADIVINSMVPIVPYAKAGKLRALAVHAPARVAQLADVPTMAEAGGIKGYASGSWQGVLAPSKTPAAIVGRLNAELAKALALQDSRDRFAALGTDALGGTPAEFASWIRSEIARWSEVVKRAKLKL